MATKRAPARRTRPFAESVIREMTRLGDQAGAVNLSQGLPDFDSPPLVLDAALTAIREGDNQYTFPFGTFAFRQAVAGKYRGYNHIAVDPECEVTITCGVSEALMATILALTDPGDEVIIPEPWYENYVPGCLMAGVVPRYVPLHEPEYWFDLDELEGAFNSKTRLILINTPHNPTGRVFSRDELETVARLCQQYGVVAVTDEIYDRILYDGHCHISIGSLEGMHDRTVTISGLGKTYAVTGWRIGWAVACKQLTDLVRKVHDYLTICAPAPFQAAGIVALGLPETYYQQMCAEYAVRREILMGALDGVGLPYCRPEGAYYAMLDVSNVDWPQEQFSRCGWSRDRAFAEYMAREIGVAVVPGSSFYAEQRGGTDRVRINFAKRESTLCEAALRLRRLGNVRSV